jgi:hypothetical protein
MKMLYEILKTSNLGASFAPDMYTALWAQKLARDGEVKTLSGAPPLSFKANGQPLLDYLISGNTVQSGTPTPDNPVMPQGTGERTGNLWNNLGFSANTISTAGVHSLSNTYGTSLSTVSGGSVDITQVASGGTAAYQNGYFFIEIDISQFSLGDNIVISFDYEITNKLSSTSTTVAYVCQGTTGSNVIGNWDENGRAIIKATITSAMTRPYVEIRLCGNSIKVRNVQICLGSTALPYEPYGYKIPISSAGQTNNIYLGEVETTRKIKKLVLSSSQNWQLQSINSHGIANFYITITNDFLNNSLVISNYFIRQSTAIADTTTEGMLIALSTTTATVYIRIKSQTASTVQEFKNWLDGLSEKAAVWYVLANEETAVVNEPLMKIGDYADTLSMEQAGVEIPTARGTNTLDVLTDVKPSEIYIKYKS